MSLVTFTQSIPGDSDKRCKGDAILVGSDYSPGLATIRHPSEPRNWDKRKGYGFTGATLVFTGADLSDFEIDFYMWSEPQVIQFFAFKKKYFSLPKTPPTLAPGQLFPTPPKALGVSSPILASCNITAMVVQDIIGPDFDDFGGAMWTGKFTAFRAPLPMLARPDSAIDAAKKTTPTAQDKREQMIQSLLDETKKANDNIANGHK